MLDESICHFWGDGSILSLLCYFNGKILLANNVDPDQTPHYVASGSALFANDPFTDFQVKLGLAQTTIQPIQRGMSAPEQHESIHV